MGKYKCILIYLSPCNKITIDGAAYKQQNFITVLEARNARPKHEQILYLGGAHFLIYKWLSSCPHMVEGAKEVSGVTFTRALIL